jgi:hypothetical protein
VPAACTGGGTAGRHVGVPCAEGSAVPWGICMEGNGEGHEFGIPVEPVAVREIGRSSRGGRMAADVRPDRVHCLCPLAGKPIAGIVFTLVLHFYTALRCANRDRTLRSFHGSRGAQLGLSMSGECAGDGTGDLDECLTGS